MTDNLKLLYYLSHFRCHLPSNQSLQPYFFCSELCLAINFSRACISCYFRCSARDPKTFQLHSIFGFFVFGQAKTVQLHSIFGVPCPPLKFTSCFFCCSVPGLKLISCSPFCRMKLLEILCSWLGLHKSIIRHCVLA